MKSTASATAQMLIRKPVSEVFNAFINPAITTSFWFTKSSGILKEDTEVIWEWEMYAFKTTIKVFKIIPNQLITISWGKPNGKVDFKFRQLSNGTYVEITVYDFAETGEELIDTIKDNIGGFTTVLDGAKAWLEHGINLNLIVDKFPKEANER